MWLRWNWRWTSASTDWRWLKLPTDSIRFTPRWSSWHAIQVIHDTLFRCMRKQHSSDIPYADSCSSETWNDSQKMITKRTGFDHNLLLRNKWSSCTQISIWTRRDSPLRQMRWQQTTGHPCQHQNIPQAPWGTQGPPRWNSGTCTPCLTSRCQEMSTLLFIIA